MILVVGHGFVGSAFARAIASGGRPVVAVARSVPAAAGGAAPPAPYPVLPCDLGDAAGVEALRDRLSEPGFAGNPSGQLPTAVVHCASSGRGGAAAYERVFVGGCRNLVASFPEAALVFTSSTSVYPQTGGEEVDERSAAEPERETGRMLRQAEEIVLGAGGTVARLAGLYGPGRSAVLQRFLEGRSAIDGDPESAVEQSGRTLNQVHRDDVVSALQLLLALAPAGREQGGELYNVTDDAPMTQRECYRGLCEKFDRPLPPVAPRDPGRKRGWTDKRVSNAKIRAAGWNPRYPSFFDAIEHDPDLVPSILAQVGADG